MLYKIKDNYYILVDGKYVEVLFKSENDGISIIPDRKKFIEKNSSVNAEQILFDDKFKEKIKSSMNKPSSRNSLSIGSHNDDNR